jgi:hypothetical protein
MDGFKRENVPGSMWDSAEFVVATSLANLNSGRVVVIPGRKNQALVYAAQNPILGKLVALADRMLRR